MVVDEVEYGRGAGTTMMAAKEEASRRALRSLYIDLAKRRIDFSKSSVPVLTNYFSY